MAGSAEPVEPAWSAAVATGFASLPVAPAVRAAAAANLGRWLEDEEFAAYRPLLRHLIAEKSFALLLDAFYQVLPFGTGGRRGPVGPGPNRFNPWTLATSVAGHLEFLRERFGRDGLAVVIGYDTREFHDVRGLYPRELRGPLAGVTSRSCAELAARVYTTGGVRVFLSARVMATPELSFAIRHLGAHGGLVVSASHNPPDDNGAKVYDHRGGQEIPPEDQAMVDRVAAVTQVAAGGDPRLVEPIPPAVHAAYIERNLALRTRRERGGARVVYTPLHGTGATTVGEVLAAAGFAPIYPERQAEPDGRFPTVPFGIANPEVPESMARATATARAESADIVLATDPDADRIGAAVRDRHGDYRALSGNEICALVVHEVLRGRRALGTLPARPLVIKTEVTSDLVTRVARAAGAAVVGDLLVGFKWVAAVLDVIERTGRYRDFAGTIGDFVVAVEESHGVLLSSEIRDKDAAGPALVLAEMAARVRAEGRTVPDVLDDLHRAHGVVVNRLTSMVMRGAEGQAAIERIQEGLRRDPPAAIGGVRVRRFADHWDEGPGSRFGPIRAETDRAARNVLVFELADDSRVLIRPSGTEPKNKTYIEAASAPPAPGEDLAGVRAAVAVRARTLEEAFVAHCLGLIGVTLPPWALKISGLVALDEKIDFAARFVRELEERVAALAAGGGDRGELGRWIDERLARYGKDARLLVGEALAAYVRGEIDRCRARGDGKRAAVLALMGELFGGERAS